MGTYTKSWTNRAPRPRSERLRRIGGFAGSVLASASAGSDIPSSAPDWFLPMTLGEETYLLLNPKYVGLAADGWLASGGIGQGASGGGTDLNRVWESLTNNTDFPNEKINLAHIPDVPYTQVTGLDSWVAGKGYALASSVPTALSQLTDDSTHRLVTDAQIAKWTNKRGNVQSDWNATTGLAAILNKPSLSAVATSGSYNDLSNTPSIPNENTVSGWGFTKNTGTVTSVGLAVPTGLSVSGSPITASGTLAISFANGYSIPTTSKQSGWDAKYDKPSGGIPKTDLASAVQTSLGKADTALQSETDPVYSAWIGTSRTKNTVFAAPSNENGMPSFRALVASDIPSLTISKISDAETWISGKGYALASDLTTLAGRVTSIEDWFEIETVNGQSTLHVKQGRALYSDSWIASGGIGSGSSGGSSVTWGTKSGYTRPLTVEGETEVLLLDGALSGYATTSAMNTALAGKQDSLAFTLQGTSGATYNLANALYGDVISSNADIGTSLTTIATVAGVEIKAKITHQSLSGYALVSGDPDYDFEVGSLIIGDGALTIGNDYRPVWQYPGTDITPTVTKNLAYLEEVVTLSGQQRISGTKIFSGSVQGGASQLQTNWSITNAGAATFASLTLGSGSVTGDVEFGGSLFGPISSGTERYWAIDNDGTASFSALVVGGTALVPSNYVTLTGAQTIAGEKTFSAQLTASSGIVTGNDIRPASNLGASLGNGNYRFSGLSVNTISSSAYYFRDSAWSAIAHYAGGFDDGIGYMCIYLDADPSNQNPPQNPHYYFFGSGSFQGGGGTKNLGSSGVPWGDVYIANNKAIKSPDTGGTIRDLFKLANNDWLYIGNNGITSVQLNATGYIKMYWDSGDAYASFGAGANAYFPNLLPNGTSGTKNLGSSSVRWNNIYGVNADLSGNLTLSGTTKRIYFGDTYYIELVNIGTTASPLYALHTNAPLYSDGFIAAGGVQQTS